MFHTSRVWPSLDEPALHLGDQTATYGDLLLIGAATGLLASQRAETKRALYAIESGIENPGREQLRAEAVAFRNSRGLQSGEDLREWLKNRDLTTALLEDHLRRTLATKSFLAVEDAPVSENVDSALVVDLACSGWWKKVADETTRFWTADCLSREGNVRSVPPEPGEDEAADEDDDSVAKSAEQLALSLPLLGILDVARSIAVLRELRTQQVALDKAKRRFRSSEIVARRIADHSLDWTRFTFDEIKLPSRVAANEAMMCARDDHMDPEEIAHLAGVEVQHREHRRDELPVGMAAMLSGAIIDEALGPVDAADGVRVLWLRERRTPSIEDPRDRDPAALELLDEALERVGAGRVWALGPL